MPGLDYAQCASSGGTGAPPARVDPGAFFLLFFSLSHGGCERDTGRRPGSASGQLSRSPYLKLISESPDPGCGPGRRELATRHRMPARLRLGSTSARLGSAAPARRGDSETGKRGLGGQPVTPPGRATRPCSRPCRSGERSALPRSGQDRGPRRGGALDRGHLGLLHLEYD